ncbi:probable ribonuclease ZC3H12B isoform X2 [Macrobrachium rosenbergii]|uniref:probable ribonuclease ZC3H12B isoform X2 n=1 Tax=Macrobrachium rosenbergii TaxID=79674 RepID=UPI0034D6517F
MKGVVSPGSLERWLFSTRIARQDVVCVAVGERGVVGSGCLLSAMSGVEAPPEAAPSPPPSSPHPAHHTAHDDDLPVTATTATSNTAVVSSSESLAQGLVRSRRKLENEDSSYDSDFEPCEWTPASPRPEDDQHDDVCRTVSDTLGAEFAEYVTIKHGNPSTTSSSSSSVITRTDTAPSSTSSSSSHTTHLITSSSSSSKVAVATAAVITTTSSADARISSATVAAPVTTSVNIATPTVVTTTTVATVSTTKVSSSTSSKEAAQGSPDARATSPAVRLPSSSPPPPPTSSSVGPPSVSVTPPAPVVATMPPAVTVIQTPAAASVPCSSSVSSCSSSSCSSHTPAVTITSDSTSSPTSSSSSSTVALSSSSSEVSPGVSWVIHHSGYASQVEFGVKLGYSEALVQQALIKFGGIPDKDELLAELIRLGTSQGRSEGEDVAADDLVDIKEDSEQQQQSTLKPIIIDGSNVAMRHGNKTVFSCRGLRICVDWFRARGHNEITVFVPAWRKEAPRWDTPITDQEILLDLEQENVLVFTPSRVCGGKRIVSYDDRYILNEAVETGGVVVSNDNYRDLAAESPAFRKVVEESLLMYSWVNGRFVPPDDPLGRNGPTLDAFLRKTPKDRQAPCPYGRKCTYGNKCKYMHPERGTAPLKSVTERLQEQAQRHYQKKANSRDSSPGDGLRLKSLSLPVGVADSDVAKKPLQRTQSNVPSVSLTLPSALTQETPTHDMGPNTATSSASHTRHLMAPQMESHPLDPLHSSTMFKSESSLYHLYPSQGHQASYGSSTWGWDGQNTIPNPQAGPSHSQPQSYGAHMPLTKNLSDPDSISSDNPHKKLQRQLTLNPTYDSRLYKIVGFKEPAPELFPLAQQQQQQAVGQVSPSRSVKRDSENLMYPQVTGRVSPGYSSQFGSREQLATGGLHPPLTRHSSSQESAKHMTSLQGHLYPPYSHPHVTRFASAPDPIWGGHQQQPTTGPPPIARLSSTSDTRLNLYGCGTEAPFISESYDEQLARLPPFHSAATHSPVPAAPSPGPIGSRPMSPQQGPVHLPAGVSSRPLKPSQQHLPSQQTPGFSNPITGAASHEDARLRVYYHLSNLFPEAQVRAALAMYPEETDPYKICTSIFSINPGPVGSRPMSPQQPAQSTVSHQAQNIPVRGSSPLTAGFPSPLSMPASSHEDARLRAFYHLSQLFPEAQVRAVLARFPDETDAQTLCATLIGLSGNQS